MAWNEMWKYFISKLLTSVSLPRNKEKYWNKEHNSWTKEGREKNKYEYASKTTVNQRRVFSISCPKMGALESV